MKQGIYLLLLVIAACATNKGNLEKQTQQQIGVASSELSISKITKSATSVSWLVSTQSGQCFSCISDSFVKDVSCVEKMCGTKQTIAKAENRQTKELEEKNDPSIKGQALPSQKKQTPSEPVFTQQEVEAQMQSLLAKQKEEHRLALEAQEQKHRTALATEQKKRVAAEKLALERAEYLARMQEAQPGTNSSPKLKIDPTHDEVKTTQRAKAGSFFIQLASLSHYPDQALFKAASSYGSVYVYETAGIYKVRLGAFSDKLQTRDALQSIRALGFHDAFLVKDQYDATSYLPLY